MKFVRENACWIIGAALSVALLPLAARSGLPFRYSWLSFTLWYSVLMLQSVVAAVVLYAIGEPKELFAKISSKYSPEPFPARKAIAVLLPALGFYLGSVLITAYNDIIAVARFDGRADLLLTRADAWILRGGSVSLWAHYVLNRWPSSFGVMEVIYFGLSPLIGACIIILGMSRGLKRAMQFLGAVLIGYYISLLLFYLIPATGPSFTCPDHFAHWPASIMFDIQRGNVVALDRIANGFRQAVRGDYYMVFPCMHLVQPLLILWFLRDHKRMAWVIAIYIAVLTPSILLLEQHYLVDILAAFPVTAIAIAMVESGSTELSAARQRLSLNTRPADLEFRGES